ncbi:hypothetical protein [Hyalangium minutum]|uniref:Outer membrane protein beta-barrel domain-containing protein n=1 Tax=Hyalangium minutum TaxID=394096 RepID=A0A085WVU5_9BACT|nr:hypothetical protein [Hyalangium minutum]KFE71808.1 hypothetical protein DB31_0069 [Hyalangium minutum]
MLRTSCAPLSALILVLLSAPAAQASDFGPQAGATYVNPGLLLSGSYRHSGKGAFGLGAELSLHHFTNNDFGGFGVFAQWQAMNFQYDRFCGGLQATDTLETFPIGMELGVAYETEGGGEAATTSLHFAPFASVGAATATLRFGIPIAGGTEELPRHGFDVGLTLAIKIPLRLDGPSPFSGR